MDLESALTHSEEIVMWVQANLESLTLRKIQGDKRSALAAACWHTAIEHDQAIVMLAIDELHGSMLALVRPLFESYVRGMWLMHAASEAEVDRAGADQFPHDCDQMIEALERKGVTLSSVESQSWSRLCSFDHTGYERIATRLSAAAIGPQFEDAEIVDVLTWGNSVALLSAIATASLSDNGEVAVEALNLLRKTNHAHR
jgi:hypothetical protein